MTLEMYASTLALAHAVGHTLGSLVFVVGTASLGVMLLAAVEAMVERLTRGCK